MQYKLCFKWSPKVISTAQKWHTGQNNLLLYLGQERLLRGVNIRARVLGLEEWIRLSKKKRRGKEWEWEERESVYSGEVYLGSKGGYFRRGNRRGYLGKNHKSSWNTPKLIGSSKILVKVKKLQKIIYICLKHLTLKHINGYFLLVF